MNPYDEINKLVKKFEQDFVGHILNRIILELEKNHAISEGKES